MNKKYFGVILLMMFLCLIGCKSQNNDMAKEKEASAYGIVNKAYVGKATVRIKNNKIVDVTYDEAFLPQTWANVSYTQDDDKEFPEDLLSYVKDEENTYYAKYISINDTIFTGTIRENDLVLDNTTYVAQTINYANDKIPDLFAYLYNSDANCQWYFDAVKNGKVFICDKDGKKLDTYSSLNTYGWLKSEGKYWNASEDSPLGWKGNIDAMIDYLKGKELTSLDSSKFTKDTEGEDKDGYNYKYWTIDGVKTKVTMTDVYAYYKLAYNAYEKAKALSD